MAGDKNNVKMGSAWLAYMPLNGDGRFRWLGYSEGGPTFQRSPDRTDIMVDQLDTPIFSRVTAENMTASFPSVEVSVENILLAFPSAVLSPQDRIDIYPESTATESNTGGVVVIHPVFAGAPIGDYLDLDNLGTYDPSSDIMFVATLTSELDISFSREDMIHIPLTFNATPDPVGRLAVWFNPFESDFSITGTALTGTGTSATGSLIASGATFAILAAKGWSLSGNALTYTIPQGASLPVTAKTLVYATGPNNTVGFAVATATVTAV